ncbi:MAG: FAD-dependent oxidoreductase [Pseudoflavonifractor sp.]
MKIIVIGSISSGLSVAERLAAGDPDAQIVLYEKAAFCSCGTHGLPHYLGLPIRAVDSAVEGCTLSAQGVQIHAGHEVVALHLPARQVSVRAVDTGEISQEGFDRLVVATGSRSMPLTIPGAARMGVHPLHRMSDLLLLREFLRTPYVRDIVILGGTLSALELAGAFLQLGRKVRVIDGGAGLLPGFDGEVRARIQRELESLGIVFHLGETVTAFRGRTFVESVQTDRACYDCDLCVPALGALPNSELLPEAARDDSGHILVGEDWQTSLPDIYAAGSCAARKNPMAATLGIRVGPLEIARAGLTEEEAARCSLSPASTLVSGQDRTGLAPNEGGVTVKLVYQRESLRVLGAQIWGSGDAVARINAVAVAAQAGMTVRALEKTSFVSSTFASAPWDPIQLACAAVKA